jgi:hypothetical protein
VLPGHLGFECRQAIAGARDLPISGDGIRWRDLQAWWKDTQHIADDDAAKKSLYQGLSSSLPANSPPQQKVYDLCHKIYGTAVPDLPALLPEVWLHWDHKTARERSREALLRFRMDAITHPGVTSAILGPRTMEQLEDALAGAEVNSRTTPTPA